MRSQRPWTTCAGVYIATASTTVVVTLLLVTPGCMTRYKPNWMPPRPPPGSSPLVQVDASFSGDATEVVGFLYAETDGDRGADRCVRVYGEGTWTLSYQNPVKPGTYDLEVARGAVGDDGVLEGFPESFAVSAVGIWRGPGCDFTINGAEVPDGYRPR